MTGEYLPALPHPEETPRALPAGREQHRTGRELMREGVRLLPNMLKLLTRLSRDRRVPLRRKLIAVAVVGYVVSPIDLVPDVIPIAGRIDDLVLIAFAVDRLLEGAPEDLVDEYWDGAADTLEFIREVLAWGTGLLPGPLRRFLD